MYVNFNVQQLMEDAGFCLWQDESWKPENAFIDWALQYDEETVNLVRLTVNRVLHLMEDGYTDVEVLDYFGIN